jgi:NAD-dependent dihydropyrimidine dehydrogenase PreA subunit
MDQEPPASGYGEGEGRPRSLRIFCHYERRPSHPRGEEKMAMIIDQDVCIQCGVCVPECPNESISEEDGTYIIDKAACTECAGFADEPSCAAVCPVDSILKDES